MMIMLKKGVLLCAVVFVGLSQSVKAEDLRIIGEDTSFVTRLPSGDSITITREMTPCAKIKAGCSRWYQNPALCP
jgi:hypothetical protein